MKSMLDLKANGDFKKIITNFTHKKFTFQDLWSEKLGGVQVEDTIWLVISLLLVNINIYHTQTWKSINIHGWNINK